MESGTFLHKHNSPFIVSLSFNKGLNRFTCKLEISAYPRGGKSKLRGGQMSPPIHPPPPPPPPPLPWKKPCCRESSKGTFFQRLLLQAREIKVDGPVTPYPLRVQRNMILPWLRGSVLPGDVVMAYCVAVSWARHLTAYWSPCDHQVWSVSCYEWG